MADPIWRNFVRNMINFCDLKDVYVLYIIPTYIPTPVYLESKYFITLNKITTSVSYIT